jgi:ribonucleoside-diphosphate reductase alpha chain
MKNKSLKYFNGDELASSVFNAKYKAENEETPDDMHKRMAKEFHRIEQKYQFYERPAKNISKYGKERKHLTFKKIYNYFKDFKYIIPQGSIMATLGTSKISSLSNCWVIDEPNDSYASILKADAEAEFLYTMLGGVGT